MERIARIFEAYDGQGIHRTASDGDARSARWLADEVRAAGVEPVLAPVPLDRLEPVEVRIEVGERSLEGIPLYDCGYTDADGVVGALGPLGSSAPIGIGPLGSGAERPQAQAFQEARRAHAHRALVGLCDGPRFGMPPGPTLLNAERFDAPFGPPAIQVGEAPRWLLDAVEAGASGRVIAHVHHTRTEAHNVEARVRGQSADLPPLVVMTPRSGWWRCASERGGGLACWLEILRAVTGNSPPQRDVLFVATTGHELGHLGLRRFLSGHSDLVKGARAWIHLGANFAAANASRVLFQASDAELAALGRAALERAGAAPDAELPIGTRPFGEARDVFDGGGRVLSLLGGNGRFHHPDDRWPDAVDLDRAARIASAFREIGAQLAAD